MLLPAPLGPVMVSSSPARTSMLTPCSTRSDDAPNAVILDQVFGEEERESEFGIADCGLRIAD